MKPIKNNTSLWLSDLPKPKPDGNKYDRGHLVILGGTDMTGAARLASEAAMQVGCGLCTIVSAKETKDIYLSGPPHIMFEAYTSLPDFPSHLADPRRNACVIGPGAGKGDAEELRHCIEHVLRFKKPTVVDADALNVFDDRHPDLSYVLHENCVLTPHEGEFSRLFPFLDGTREERVQKAVQLTGAVILLKGPETIICNPTGDMIINDHATPWLATAGAGDVLAGMIGGLLAEGMPVLKACAAATWIHGEAAIEFGPGLTAPNIIGQIPQVLRELMADK
ncbi:MAG TPA: NAD(P)H-hydrate dehydratase [Alphaproteobacteria bacterium]|jgi:ADP-dependent NAD(P)H-hydrate dehydratase / NAD(P)H-hydrate epimerase|nr:NAD(P)H-hydrate dehydratase [Micavibrio sp.]MBK9562477.1 NAD(P)H-hydrate dehydratase [Micavibrio sp.]HQX27180.1 NAD(P)H-hydrate dehydratase [Alphaproteobacteria bacterium]